MDTKYVILFLAVIFSLCSFGQTTSQQVDIKWGTEYKDSRKVTLSDIIGYDESGIYALTSKVAKLGYTYGYTLEHYNHQMNRTKAVRLSTGDNTHRVLEYVILYNERLYMFSSLRDNNAKTKTLYVQTIDKNTLTPNDDLRKISEISYEGKSKRNSGSFDYEFSTDEKKLMIYHALPYDKGEYDQFGFHVFNENFDLIWEKDITLPYKEELFDVERYKVDNDGNAYLLGLVFKDKRRVKRKGDPNYNYHILSYTNLGTVLKEYTTELPDKFLTDMQIAITDDHDIICAGFYSGRGTFTIKGSYFFTIDGTTKEIRTSSNKEFGIDFITQNLTERKAEKLEKKAEKGKNIELYEYELDEIILREDGGALLVGEQYYVEVVTTTSYVNGMAITTTTYYYNYNDIIVVNINPQGEIEWAQKVPKRQVTTNDGGFFSSYTMSVVGDKLYFVFNDHPNNLYYNGTGKLYNFNKSKESLVVLVELDSEGNQTKEALFSMRDSEVLTRPKVCEQISDNEMIIFGQKKKTHRFAKLTFKE